MGELGESLSVELGDLGAQRSELIRQSGQQGGEQFSGQVRVTLGDGQSGDAVAGGQLGEAGDDGGLVQGLAPPGWIGAYSIRLAPGQSTLGPAWLHDGAGVHNRAILSPCRPIRAFMPQPSLSHSAPTSAANHMIDCPIGQSIEQFVGSTPLVRLQRLPGPTDNLILLRCAQEQGTIRPGDTLIEATSGNTGIVLTMAAAIMGYRMVLIMSEHMSVERRAVMRAFGATIVLTP